MEDGGGKLIIDYYLLPASGFKLPAPKQCFDPAQHQK